MGLTVVISMSVEGVGGQYEENRLMVSVRTGGFFLGGFFFVSLGLFFLVGCFGGFC